jgi:hypothetical protein
LARRRNDRLVERAQQEHDHERPERQPLSSAVGSGGELLGAVEASIGKSSAMISD